MSEIQSPGKRLTDIEVYPGIDVFVTTVGPTRREFAGGWTVQESGGVVKVIPAEDLDDEATWHAPIHEFELPDKWDKRAAVKRNPVLSAVESLAWGTMTAIARHELESLDGDTLKFEGSLRIESELIQKSDAPEELVAAFCDVLKSSYAWIWVVVDELELPGMPDFDLEIEILLGQADSEYTVASERLKATADHFQWGVLDVYKSVDPAAARMRFLPSVVAVPYSHIATELSLKPRLSTLLQTFEAVVRYLATVALLPLPEGDRDARLRAVATYGPTPPTLGVYVRMLRDNLGNLPEFLPEVARALRRTSGKATALGKFILDELPTMRNQIGPHGGVGPEAMYVEPYQQLAERLEELMPPLATDGHSTVLVVRAAVDTGKNQTTYDYTLIELRGDTVALPRARFPSDEKLDAKKVYLLHSPSGKFIDADPLVLYDVCPVCGFDEAFLLNRFDAKSPQWFSYRGGHRTP